MARDMGQLHPRLQNIIKTFLSDCEKQGLNVKVTDCLRTKAEQDALYAIGRNQAGVKIGATRTSVKYPYGYHCWGLAFDFCRNEKGKEYNEAGNFFAKVGAIGKKNGLKWGGDWSSPDKPHFELQSYGTCKELVSKYTSPDRFFRTWSETGDKLVNPYKKPEKKLIKGSRGEDVKYCQWVLNKLGYDTKGIDGIFGDATYKAVGQYQKDKGWNPSYNIGKITREALINEKL